MTTTEIPAAQELPGVQEILERSWNLYKSRIWLLLAVGGAGAAGCMLAAFVPFIAAFFLVGAVPAFALWTTTLLIALSLSLWGTSWAQAAMLEAILDPEFKPEWTQCYRDSWPKVASFSWVCVLFFAVLCGGLVFVVPALFLGVAFVFAPVLVVAEQIGAFESFERSLALVSGRWGAVALRLFAGGAASALPGMIPWLGVILGSVAAPFAMINAVVVYDSLRRLPARSEPPPWWQSRLPLGLCAAGLLVMTLIGVRTAQAVRAALPEFEAQYRQMMAHPPDPEKLQQLVEKLQNGGSVEALSEAFKLVQPSTGAAAGTPAPGPAQ